MLNSIVDLIYGLILLWLILDAHRADRFVAAQAARINRLEGRLSELELFVDGSNRRLKGLPPIGKRD